MGSAAEFKEPTTGTEPLQLEEEDEQVFELERKKTASFPRDGTDTSTVTTANTSSSSSSADEGEHSSIEVLEVREEHHDGNNCIVYLDKEQGTHSAAAEPDGCFSKDPSPAHQLTGDVIEEELDIQDAEDYDVEKVLDTQETHDLFCPNCHSCITKRVILKRRKRRTPYVPKDPKRFKGPQPTDPILRSQDSLPSAVDDAVDPVRESFVFKCLSCLSIFIPSRGVEGLNTHPKPQEQATTHSNWFTSIFKKNQSAIERGGAMPSGDSLNLSIDTAGSTAITSSKSPALVQDGATSVQVATSHDTSKVVNSGVIEEGQKFPVPSPEEETQQKIDKDDATTAEGNHTSHEGGLSPIKPARDMNITNTVTSGPDGVRVETVFHSEGVPHRFEGTGFSDTVKPDFGPGRVTGVMDTSDTGFIYGPPNSGIDALRVSLLDEGTLTKPLLEPGVEGRRLEILKSIVYGGLIESITSLGVISSAAGSGATMLNILVLGIANLMGGLILMIHSLQELRDEVPRLTTTENDQVNGQEEGRYKLLLGRRENFTLHASVAILSFIVVGLVPPVVYYFSFSKTHNRNYKVASVFGSSLVFIILLAIAKARVKSPRGSYLKSILYYALIAVSVSGISCVVGNFVDHLLEKYGWSDGSETPAGERMLSLMGRRAGNFGHSSSF